VPITKPAQRCTYNTETVQININVTPNRQNKNSVSDDDDDDDIIIIIISFMQGVYTYIPETNCVPREYSVAAMLLLLFMVLVSLVTVLNLLYFYISTFRSMCAVPNMAVFCSSLTSCFPGMLLAYFLNDFEIVPVAPIILVAPLLLLLLLLLLIELAFTLAKNAL